MQACGCWLEGGVIGQALHATRRAPRRQWQRKRGEWRKAPQRMGPGAELAMQRQIPRVSGQRAMDPAAVSAEIRALSNSVTTPHPPPPPLQAMRAPAALGLLVQRHSPRCTSTGCSWRMCRRCVGVSERGREQV